ncbi:polyprenyl synthetase family protein [Streptomyces sp. NPDC050534]|uniref:polyprenyl synthetase family protein n=1 Tax=Streptomyces sp. NPDC050534 TaxID=3365625 RepID=UPI00378A9A21
MTGSGTSPTAAKDHCPAPCPGGEPTSEQGFPPLPQGPAEQWDPARTDHSHDTAHGAHRHGPDDPRAVDANVAGAVRGVLAESLDRRMSAAESIDPLFAKDLAARVADFTQDGGKLTRSRFVWWSMRACGGGSSVSRATLRIASALELIQTCALVHDDVMDAAPVRRGRPSLHAGVAVQYGDAVPASRSARLGQAAAILAGDLALVWADDMVADTELPSATAARVKDLWSSMRMEMVAGQYLDVQGEATSARSLARAVRAACLKSALYSVERPLSLGAALAGAPLGTTRALSSVGRNIGLAFQLRDDLLDAFGDPRGTGKPSGGDIRSGKPTYLAAVAQARAESAGDRRALAVLQDTLGRADASDAELATVRDVFEATGARATVETKIERLVVQGLQRLDGVPLAPHAGSRLRELLRAAAGAPADAERPAPDDPVAVSMLPTAAEEGGRR